MRVGLFLCLSNPIIVGKTVPLRSLSAFPVIPIAGARSCLGRCSCATTIRRRPVKGEREGADKQAAGDANGNLALCAPV